MGAFRRGTIFGLAVGYYFGSKAGRERHEQIRRVMRWVQTSPTYQRVSEKVGAAVGLGFERGKLVMMDGLKRGRRQAASQGPPEHRPDDF